MLRHYRFGVLPGATRRSGCIRHRVGHNFLWQIQGAAVRTWMQAAAAGGGVCHACSRQTPTSIPCTWGMSLGPILDTLNCVSKILTVASLAQLAEHALRKRMVVGSIPTGGFEHVCGNSSWKLMLRHYCLKSCRELPGATAGVGTGSDIILFGKFVAQQCPCGCKPLRLGMGCATLVPNPRQQVYHAHGA